MKIKTVFVLFLTISLATCGKLTGKQKIEQAITDAHRFLTEQKCGEALAALNKVSFQTSNPDYLSAYASAQACRSDFREPAFFANSVDSIGTENGTLLPSLTTMPTSVTSSSIDQNYQALSAAIDTLLYAGDIDDPSHTNRVDALGEEAAQNLSLQTLYMVLVKLGKYFYLHGNTDASGNKGQRDTSANQCLTDYTNSQVAIARNILSGVTPSPIFPCNSDSDGHSELASGATDRKKYLCEGIVLFNNFLDLIASISIVEENSGNLSDLQDGLTDLCAPLGLATLCTQKSQALCESNESIRDIEVYFLNIFETMLRRSS